MERPVRTREVPLRGPANHVPRGAACYLHGMGGASSASRFADRVRSRRILVVLAFLTLAASLALACNALLSNEDGVFVTDEGGPPMVDGGSPSDSFAPIPGCEKTPSEDPSALQDKCAIFVFKTVGLDTNTGTAAAPVATIKRAIELATAHQKYRVYLCNAEYAEDVTMTKVAEGVSLFGGLACADFKWSYLSGTRAVIAGTGGSVGFAFTITDVVRPLVVEDIEIRGATAGAAFVSSDPDGGAQPLITFSRCLMTARDGGVVGIFGQPQTYDAGYFDGLPASGATGGAEKACACPIGSNSGGQGGNSGVAGAAGKPAGAGGGNAGCTDGLPGASAATPGADGSGASRLGRLDRGGWSPEPGTSGQYGQSGQPGGGGGGSAGGGGGGGGCGGCGGYGSMPGPGGAGAIALAVAYSTVSVVGCRLVAGSGGSGGIGGPAYPGVNGGDGGAGACAGGRGGNGAAGGAAGGGAGGVSAGILYVGRRPDVDPATTITVGPAGAKGFGAFSTNATLDGVAGASAPILEVKP